MFPRPETYFFGESNMKKRGILTLVRWAYLHSSLQQTLTDGYFARQDLALPCGMYKLIDTWNPQDFGTPKR